jgi:hypothetical protein
MNRARTITRRHITASNASAITSIDAAIPDQACLALSFSLGLVATAAADEYARPISAYAPLARI